MDPITIAMGLAQFAPGIIKLLTGSDKAADVAGAVVGVAQAATGTDSGAAALDKLRADPNAVLNFQQAMSAQQADLEKAFLSDAQNARGRDVELAKLGQKNHRADIMIGAAMVLVIFCLVAIVWKTDMNEFAKGGITLILGRALGWVEQAFSFELGSTRNNRAKDDTINKLAK